MIIFMSQILESTVVGSSVITGLLRISQIPTHSIDFSVLSKIFLNYFLVLLFDLYSYSLTLLEAFLNRKQVQYKILLLPKRLEFHCSLTAKLSFIGFE